MSPPGRHQSLLHHLRRAHPAAAWMRRTAAALEQASPEEIRRYQERRLRFLVRLVAARSPFYRRWFAETGVDPRSIRTLDDLAVLPILDRSHLVTAPEDFAVAPLRAMWPARSSGTSGRIVTVYRTPGSSAYEMVALQRQWSWFGLGRDARRVVLRGNDFAADHPDRVTMEVPGNRQLLVSSFHLNEETLPRILAAMRAFGPDAVEGWPSSIALLAALMRDAGEKLAVRAVITSSEVMSPGQRALMQEIFAGPIVDHYGQTERAAMVGDCEHGGFHIFPDYGIVELLPVEGAPDRIELVGTPLHNWGFPLLRYRTGDEFVHPRSDTCACGRAFPLVGPVDGRVEDAFTARDGRVVPLPATAIDDLTGLVEAQIVQHAPGRFEIRMVPGVTYDADATMATATRNVTRLFGPGQTLTFTTMDRLPRPASGKLRPAVVVIG